MNTLIEITQTRDREFTIDVSVTDEEGVGGSAQYSAPSLQSALRTAECCFAECDDVTINYRP